ncbi:TniQ family protein [Ensifer sp. ENS04]|uniref:TniQ family protein n=1 Tax=Ensifer sp. ENS04 TaxID=2769281 RepID=UPI00177CF81E|nr:TniQ family protein [Ensifer sp. ENS04]MBD9538948.1 TniQ family protein [Ensifer sp. ENS04]
MSGLFKVPFFEDEIFTSYLSRIARANGRASSYSFCTDLGLDIHAINRGEEVAIENFARLLRVPSEDLVARALKLDENGNAVFDGGVFGKNTLRKTKPGTCPECLAEDESDLKRMPGTRKYQRVSWLFADVSACVRHSCQLVEIDGFLDHRRMDFQLMLDFQEGRVSAAPVRRSATPFEVFVCDRLAGRKTHGDFLDSFSLSAAMSLCTLFGIAAEYGKHTTRRSLDDVQIAVASNRGFRILEQGEAGICGTLNELAAQDKSINTRGGASLYGRLYRRLLDSYPGEEFDRIRSIIRHHTLANVPLLPGSDVFGRIEESPWRTVSDIASKSEVATSVVYKLLEARGHRLTKYDAVPENVANSITNELTGMVDGKEACAVLGTTPTIFWKLVCSGFIPVNGFDLASDAYTPVRRYPRAGLLRLRRSLIDRANSPVQAAMLSVSAASRLTKVSAVEILNHMLGGELGRVAYQETPVLLDSLLVLPREVVRAAYNVDGLTAEETAAKLSVNRHSVLWLRAQGHIQATRIGGARHEAYIFGEDEIAIFNARFVSVTKLEKETSVNQVEIRRRMKVLNVVSAFPARSPIYAFLHRRDAQMLIGEEVRIRPRDHLAVLSPSSAEEIAPNSNLDLRYRSPRQ